ncbi:MAG: double zinc ribbon domain-containing protein, partial [Planctomycetota bacterium]
EVVSRKRKGGPKKCPTCSAKISAKDFFCVSCGHQLKGDLRKCSSCGGFPAPDDEFCTFCGAKIG